MMTISRMTTLSVLSLTVLLPLLKAAPAQAQAAIDPTYSGSSYNQVLNVLEGQGFVARNSSEKAEFDAYRNGALPQYRVDFLSLGGLFSSPLKERSIQTIHERTDSYPYFKKFVHANGVCVLGKWEINQPTPYTGYFKTGARGLFVGRISVALEETTRAGKRGFGFAGKIFPTTNPNSIVPTTNFFTVDELSGTPAEKFFDVALTNEPPLFFGLDLTGQLLKIFPAFTKADSSPLFRPVTQIARTAAVGAVNSPIWMRLRPAATTVKNNQPDFRSEVVQAMEDNGKLVFLIETSTTTKDRNATTGWTQAGTITLDRAITSFGCDRQLHFSHPHDDKSNQPATSAQAGAK